MCCIAFFTHLLTKNYTTESRWISFTLCTHLKRYVPVGSLTVSMTIYIQITATWDFLITSCSHWTLWTYELVLSKGNDNCVSHHLTIMLRTQALLYDTGTVIIPTLRRCPPCQPFRALNCCTSLSQLLLLVWSEQLASPLAAKLSFRPFCSTTGHSLEVAHVITRAPSIKLTVFI